MSNKDIKDFENAIAATINQSGLPIEVIRLALYQIYTDVQNLAVQAISQERTTTVEQIIIGGDEKNGENL